MEGAATGAAVDAVAAAAGGREMAHSASDRFGLLLRPGFVREMRRNLDRIEIIQIIADDWLGAPAPWLVALRALAHEIPLHVHGIGLGLASVCAIEQRRCDELARLIGGIRPDKWSEHLAFVRAGGIEIGHLAAPPRTAATIEGSLRNIERARVCIGAAPELENVATLIDPPGSELTETEFLASILGSCDAPMLLDLHNLYCNAINFGVDPMSALCELPLERVSTLHVAGGRKVRGPSGAERMLDDHAHPVPPEVHELLYEFGRRTQHPIDVILEREARIPPFDVLLDELDGLRATLALGRRDALLGVAS